MCDQAMQQGFRTKEKKMSSNVFLNVMIRYQAYSLGLGKTAPKAHSQGKFLGQGLLSCISVSETGPGA